MGRRLGISTIMVVFMMFLLTIVSYATEVYSGLNLIVMPGNYTFNEFVELYGNWLADDVRDINLKMIEHNPSNGLFKSKIFNYFLCKNQQCVLPGGKIFLIESKSNFTIKAQLYQIDYSGAKVSTPLYNLELYSVGEEVNATSNETITLKFKITENNFSQTVETSIPSDFEGQTLALKIKDLTGNQLYTYYFTAQDGEEYTVTIPSEKARETVLVTGTVKDANTGEPLQGAKVCIHSSNNTSEECSLTDDDGIFKLIYPSGVEVKLDAELQGYTTNQKVVITSPEPVTIELKP